MEDSIMFRWSVFYELWMACDTSEERAELRQAIMEYGLFWKEPPQKFKRDFVNIKFILEKSKRISYLRSQAWKQWGAPEWNSNALKNWEIDIKQAKTSKTNKNKQNKRNKSLSLSNSSINKELYLEYIYLNKEEYKKLIDAYGKNVIENVMENLNNYIWQKWKDPYKSHYHTILNWLKRDGVKKLPEKPKEDSWVYENLRDQDVYLQDLIKWRQK